MHGALPTGCTADIDHWQQSAVARRVGWHVFEMISENSLVHILIDGEPISMEHVAGVREAVEVCISSGGRGNGIWAEIEVFRTPIGVRSLEHGARISRPHAFPPWEHARGTIEEEVGYWHNPGYAMCEIRSTGRRCVLVPSWQQLVDAFDTVPDHDTHPIMHSMLANWHDMIEVVGEGSMAGLLCPDGLVRYFPWQAFREEGDFCEEVEPMSSPDPAAEPILPPTPVPQLAREPSVMAPAAVEQPALTIDCWSLPGETDLALMERLVAQFIAILEAEGVPLPENIGLIAPCREAAHKRCFVYRFGTRRLHFAACSGDGGRVTLIVRCGGGFMDFLDFGRRHGGMERVRLHRQMEASNALQGKRTICLNSVLSHGRTHVRASASKNLAQSNRTLRSSSPCS
jgi:hypothetical protein